MIGTLFLREEASVSGRGRSNSNGICCFLLLFSLIFTGCGTIKTINMNESDLMPKSVAMSIFEKDGSKQWAEKPFMFRFGGKEKEFVEFNQIENALYSRTQNRLELIGFLQQESQSGRQPLIFFLNNVSESQAIELTNALRALGATKIDRLKWGL